MAYSPPLAWFYFHRNQERRRATHAVVPSRPWVPTDLGSALKARWSADSIANGAVASWTDSVAGIAVTQGTGGAQPVKAAASFNSAYAGVTFDGVDDCLVSTSFAALPLAATAGEIWALLSNAAASNEGVARRPIQYGAVTAGQSRLLGKSSTNFAVIADGTTSLFDNVTFGQSYHILGGYWSGTTEGARLNGRDFAPSATAVIGALNTGTTRLRIGASNATTAAQLWLGMVRHVFITTTLTSLERQRLEGWMAWDSGLASILDASHPYKSAAPTIPL